MKRTAFVSIIAIVCIVIVLFFPSLETWTLSGDGNILNDEKVIIGNCAVSIEVRQWKSLVHRYSTDFSFALDGLPCYASDEVRFPVSFSVSRDGSMLSQMYYDEEANHMKLCFLFYQADHSLAEIFWDGNYYILST